jgi:hypothetical protein
VIAGEESDGDTAYFEAFSQDEWGDHFSSLFIPPWQLMVGAVSALLCSL